MRESKQERSAGTYLLTSLTKSKFALYKVFEDFLYREIKTHLCANCAENCVLRLL